MCHGCAAQIDASSERAKPRARHSLGEGSVTLGAERERTLVLEGGNEWRPGCEVADRWWVARQGGAEATILTTAAQDGPERAVRWASSYFRGLGVAVRACPIQTVADASDPQLLRILAESGSVFICGGDPAAARDVLVGSPAGSMLLELYRRGVPLIGSSAGAMVLGARCLLPRLGFATLPGLGLLPNGVVVPHWNAAGASWRENAMKLVAQLEVLAVDEGTAAAWDGRSWQTLGAGRALVLSSAGELAVQGRLPSPPIE